MDVSDELADFKRIDLGKFFSLNWEKNGQRVRYVSNPNQDAAKGEASGIFSHPLMIKNSGVLRDWVIVVEEGHKFANDPNLRALLIEARKFTRKFLLVCTAWRQFSDIAKVFKPKHWEASGPSTSVASLP